MTKPARHRTEQRPNGCGCADQNVVRELARDKRVVFTHDSIQWERERTRIINQLKRYGYRPEDRMCISVALDEALDIALAQAVDGSRDPAAMVAYSVGIQMFHVRVRLGPHSERTVRRSDTGGVDHDRWLLAAACMSGIRFRKGGSEIDMWKENKGKIDGSAGAASTGASRIHKVLIAEEDENVLTRLGQTLRAAGYHVVSCTNGWDLVYHLGYYLSPEKYRKEAFDVIVADIRLPGASGLDVLRGLRREGIPPVVLIVGSDEMKRGQRVLRSAAAAVFERSIDAKDFLKVIAAVASTND